MWLQRDTFNVVQHAVPERGSVGRNSGRHAFSAFSAEVLIVDPMVRGAQSYLETHVGLPPKNLFDKRIVTVSSGDPARGTGIVFPIELHAGNSFHVVDEFVYRKELTGTKIDRRRNQPVTVHDHIDPF